MDHTNKIILCLIFLLQSCATHIYDNKLVKNYEKVITKQIGTSTCWASTAQGISNYLGTPKDQEEILSDFWQNKYGYRLGKIGVLYVKDKPTAGIKHGELPMVFKVMNVIKKGEIEAAINDDKPVVTLAHNHITTIIGYDNVYYYYADPFTGLVLRKEKILIEYMNSEHHEYGEARFFTFI
jgi:hypothetical protein